MIVGEYLEKNRYENFRGYNLTCGNLWQASRRFSLGLVVELPWKAEAEQTQTLQEWQATVAPDGTLANRSERTSRQEQDVRFHFPLKVQTGAAMQWTPGWTTSVDLAYQEGAGSFFESGRTGKVNMVNGLPNAEHPLKDAWTVRVGTEILLQGRKQTFPLRLGWTRDEIPAPDSVRVVQGWSVGTGFPLQLGYETLWVDLAYAIRYSEEDVRLIPDLPELSTKFCENSFVISAVMHF